MADDDDMWFRPKRYGYGAGLPIAWQGWVLLLGYALAVGAVSYGALYLFDSDAEQIVALLIGVLGLTGALILVSRAKTRGGWRWRWGDDDGDSR